jgi:hypothetical protein
METCNLCKYKLLALGLLLNFTLGCERYEDPYRLPTVRTLAVTSITAFSAKCGGEVTNDGGHIVYNRGVVWSTTPNPTVNYCPDQSSEEGNLGEYTSDLTYLSLNQKYYVRAFATNHKGTAYGNQVEFRTKETYAEGSGTPQNPYLLYNAEQLFDVRYIPSNDFKLIANIDLSEYSSGEGWIPIGSDYYHFFSGTFDGNGFTISNFTVYNYDNEYSGLFGHTRNATIKNLNLESINVFGAYSTGGLVGWNEGNIINCSVTSGYIEGSSFIGGLVGANAGEGNITFSYSNAEVVGYYGDIGGLVGYNDGKNISDCYSTGNVIGWIEVGGLVGRNYGDITKNFATGQVTSSLSWAGGLVGSGGNISYCYATGNVVGNASILGGLIGDAIGPIFNCYATGNVSGEGELGGFAGRIGNDIVISNCYATGDVNGIYGKIGGFVGWNGSGGITACYAIGTVTGDYDVGGLVGTNSGRIHNSYASGNVSGNNCIGGLVGCIGRFVLSENTTISKSFARGAVSGNTEVGGLVGSVIVGSINFSYYDKETTGQNDTGKGIPKSTAEMMQLLTYETWDFSLIWDIIEGISYPFFQWQE